MQKNNATRITPTFDFSVLAISHTKEVESVMMLMLTSVFKTIKETNSNRGFPSSVAMVW
jgi:hypothetical protein